MDTISQILQLAKERALNKSLSYAGALTPAEAQKLFELVPGAKLVDVRSRAEVELVGRIPHATVIEWAFYPGMQPNPDFASQLKSQLDPECLTMFICRTGGRSHNAAAVAAELGFAEAYNVLEGFEGESTPDTRQRGSINGWKVANLPWTNG